MQEDDFPGEFGGAALEIATSAFSPGTLLGGLVLAASLVLGNRMLLQAQQSAAALAFTYVVLAAVTARCAVGAIYSNGRGATEGGLTGEVVTVAGRFMLLSFVWVAPFLLSGLNPVEVAFSLRRMSSGTPGGMTGAAVAFLILGTVVTTPLFLLVASSAARLRDLFDLSSWWALFEDRDRDIASIFLLPLGVMATLSLVAVPILIGVASRDPKFAKLLLGPCFLVAASVATIVLGRLCGAFANSAFEAERMLLPAGDGSGVPSMPGLLEADAQIEAAWMGFDEDPDGSLRSLESLWTEQPSSAHVAQALCLMLHSAGREDQAVEVARHALPLCLERGQIVRAAEIFRALCEKLPSIEAKRDDLVAIGLQLSRSGDLREAANVLVAVLREDPEEARAIKGLLQLADRNLRPGGLPEDAAAVYRFLLECCPESSFADDMRRGLAEAERCLAHVTR